MVIDTGHDRTRWLAMAGVNRTQFFPYRRWDRGWPDPSDFDKAEQGRSMLYMRAQEMVTKMTISADNFWIELDRLLGAPATTAAQMEALMERYGRVWPDIHDRAIQSLDQFRSLTRALVISGMTPQEAQAKIGSREE
ncbi:MAG TPA: hypothetical protein VNS62_12450 [Candidatus Udaeobacter sp.]|nr:hypothetical protein [Candidatus Udaeobacter sp.]